MKSSTALVVVSFVLFVPTTLIADDSNWAEIAARGRQLRLENRFPEAVQLLSEAWKQAERANADSYWRALLSHNLGAIYFKMADYASAERFLDRAIRLWSSTGESHTLELATAANMLARTYMGQHRYKAAKSLLSGKFRNHAESLGPDHAEWGQWRNNEASLLFYTKEYARAKEIYVEVLEIWMKSTDASRTERLATVLHNMASCDLGLNQADEAVRTIERALKAYREQTSTNDLAQVLICAADAYATAGRPYEAESYYECAIARVAEIYPEDHPLAAMARWHYAKSLRQWGRTMEAASLEKQAKGIMDKRRSGPSTSVHVNELMRQH